MTLVLALLAQVIDTEHLQQFAIFLVFPFAQGKQHCDDSNPQ